MANVTYTVPNKNGSYDGDYVVKEYTSMIIDAGDTVTVDQPCRGLMILVQGDCTINGTLSMKQRGAKANPTASGGSDSNTVDSNGLRLPFLTSSGSDSLTAANTLFNGCGNDVRSVVANFKTISSNGTILQITREGAGNTDTSTNGANNTSQSDGDTGTSGTNHTGGGGQGTSGYETNSGYAGMGTSGSCFSGGSGGGGGNNDGNNDKNAESYGGRGGNGRTQHTAEVTGGAGNPNGTKTNAGAGPSTAVVVSSGESGTGGVIWLIVGGNLTIGSGGKTDASGSQADGIDGNGYNWCSCGGGSGGGAIKIAHRGTYTNNGTVTVAGGTGGQVTDCGNFYFSGDGGNGGAGTLTVLQVQ